MALAQPYCSQLASIVTNMKDSLLCELVKEITPDQVNGQIIIVPMTNFPAAKAGLRTSPIDDLSSPTDTSTVWSKTKPTSTDR